jgi:hypothetical protein
VAAIKAAATEAGRSIDKDHYGADFAFHFGSPDAPGVGTAMDAYSKRTGRDAEHAFAVGDADAILAQTRLLIEQVLPRAAARWPRRPKVHH